MGGIKKRVVCLEKCAKKRKALRKQSHRGGNNEAGWCGTTRRRAARRDRAECLDRTGPSSPQRRAVFGTAQRESPTAENPRTSGLYKITESQNF